MSPRTVTSGSAAIRSMSQPRSPIRVQARWPPIFPPAALPVLRSRCDQRTTLATLTVKIVATARKLSPAATRSVTLSRRSNGAPQIDHPAIDFQIDFVQMPSRMGFGSAFAQVRCDHRPEIVQPAPDGLVGDHDPAFRQQIFDVAEAQRESNIEPDRVLDDFGRKAIATIADFIIADGTAIGQ